MQEQPQRENLRAVRATSSMRLVPPEERRRPVGVGPILGHQDGTYLGRLIVDTVAPNDPTSDGLYFQITLASGGGDLQTVHQFARTATQRFFTYMHNQPPGTLRPVAPQPEQADQELFHQDGTYLGRLIVEVWTSADPKHEGFIYQAILPNGSGDPQAVEHFIRTTAHNIFVRWQRQQLP